LASENQGLKAVVREVGLRRDEEKFNSFNLTVGLVVKSDKNLTYTQGENMIKLLRKELLGKIVDVNPIIVPCPICGKGFNTEHGMNQHRRMIHEKREKSPKKVKRKKKRARKKSSKPKK
jgi:hypothetical protein